MGAGSLGMLFAAKLSPLARLRLFAHTEEQAQMIQRHGIEWSDQEKREIFRMHCASLDKVEEGAFCAEWLFLTVKQKDISRSLIEGLKKITGPKTKLLCFQNGIGHVERLAEYFDPEQIYISVTTEAARKKSVCAVEHTGRGITWIGNSCMSIGEPESAENLINLLNNAGFKASLSNNTNRIVWNKLLINAVINPLTAILRLKNGALLSSPHYLNIMKQLLDEGRRVADSQGIELDGQLWERLLEVCRLTAENSSSMLQDLDNGRETEVDWINGSLIKLALDSGVSVPTHETVYHLVKGQEKSASGERMDR